MTILVSSIVEGNRARDQKKYGDLSGLKDSLLALGSIQPIVLSKRPDGCYDLVAGGRRTRAIKEMGVKELHHGSVLDPAKLGFVFADEVPEDVRLEAELDENLHRLDMDWIDNVLLVEKIHHGKKAKQGKWGYRQTAALLGVGYSAANVLHATHVAKMLRAGDKEILACKSLREALGIRLKRKEDEALAEMQRRANESRGSGPTISISGAGGTSSFLDTLNATTTRIETPSGFTAGIPTDLLGVKITSAPQETLPRVRIPLSSMFVCGDSLNSVMSSLPPDSFDHIVTDIPYGIDMDNLNVSNMAAVSATHEVEPNVEQMERFLVQSFALVKSGGFCVFFYDLDHHEKLQSWAEAVGWKVQRWPFIACKTSACANNAAQYNLTKNYEVAMFLRKDEKSVLRKQQPTSWKAYDFAAERKLYANPFAKPFELWKDIYSMIAFPGQKVYDPFVGEMSSSRAAANCGLVPFGSEISEQHFNRGLEHMKAVYALIHKSNVEFI